MRVGKLFYGQEPLPQEAEWVREGSAPRDGAAYAEHRFFADDAGLASLRTEAIAFDFPRETLDSNFVPSSILTLDAGGGRFEPAGLPPDNSPIAGAPPANDRVPPAFNVSGISVIQATGQDSNRIDMVFLGDGYRSNEISSTYLHDVNSLVSYLLTGGILSEPFDRYRNFFNIYAVNVISNQSGADDPHANHFVDTALNASYYWDGVTARLMYINESAGDSILSQALAGTSIHTDMRFVAVNSSTYGGAGGSYWVYAGGNQYSLEIALHEMGHSFAHLADEYASAGSGGAGGSAYSGAEPSEANVTKSSSGAKWAQWLGYDQEGIGVIGAYEGANYYTSGLYRPSLNSKMNNLGNPFDAIAREQFILRFYALVNPIDSATPGSNLTDLAALNVNVIDPAIIKVRWTIDGGVLSDSNFENFKFEDFNVASGTHSVQALAYDPTDWVRGDRSSLEQKVSWTVTLTHATLHADGVHPLTGGPLSDTLIASAHPDTLSGGAGLDTLSYANSNAAVSVRLSNNSVSGGYAQGDTISGFENAVGSAFNDVLIGSQDVNLLSGGPGNDSFYVDQAADQALEKAGEGNDRVFASISYTLGTGQEIETLTTDNAAGTGTISLIGNAIANSITGNAGANILAGGGGNDILVGNAGADTLTGGAGADSMSGGLGNDFFYVDDSGDQAFEKAGEGNDRVVASISFALATGQEIEALTTSDAAGTGAISLIGNASANSITGNAGANILAGGAGNDILIGNAGADTLTGGAGADSMSGGLGNDWIYVDASGDQAFEKTGEGNDRVLTSISYTLATGQEIETLSTRSDTATDAMDLRGNELANTLIGNNGANLLDGKGGKDVLTGNGGTDTFAFTSALGAGNVDQVNGFVHGIDRIALGHSVFTAIGLGALNPNAFFAGAAAHDTDDRIVYNGATGALYYDADGNGAGAAVQFATLAAHPALTASDFQVI